VVHAYLHVAFQHESRGDVGPFVLTAADLMMVGGFYQTFIYHPAFVSSPSDSPVDTVLGLSVKEKAASETLNAAYSM